MANTDRSIGQEHTHYVGGLVFSGEPAGARIGHYEIKELIGRGGMGAVYRCQDLQLGRAVALKRILAGGSGGEAGLERFRREAQAVASLNHRNIVIVHEFSEDASGPYLVMELLEGSDLGAFVASHGAMPAADVLETAKQAGAALSYAHRRGIVHRDIKPTNLFRLKDRTVKVLDFGLARVGTDSQLSVEGFGLGTLDYVSPEQRRDATRVDHRSDLFSLGATLYYLATGRPPRVVRERDLPNELQAVVLSLMEDRPEDRPFSVEEALVALQLEGHSERPKSSPSFTSLELLQTEESAPPEVVAPIPKTQESAPRLTCDEERSLWSRPRVALVMAGVFLATGSALDWAQEMSSFFAPTLADAARFEGLTGPLVAGLFGLALSLALLSNRVRALVIALSGSFVYFLAVHLAILIGSNGKSLREVGVLLMYSAPGLSGAISMASIAALWRRPKLRDVLIAGAAGGIVANAFYFVPFAHAVWQVVVGLLIVDRSLFGEAKSVPDWQPRPAISVAGLAILLSAIGIWKYSQPVPRQAGITDLNSKDNAYYAWIPPGDFAQGCSRDDNDCAQDELPVHKVTFDKGFWFATSEVTVAAWKAVLHGLPPAAEWRGLTFNPKWSADHLPIMNVTWQEARDYCQAVDGRLPTEAEWEYAARAGSTAARYQRLQDSAIYADNSSPKTLNSAVLARDQLQTALVSNLSSMQNVNKGQANAWNVKDVLGNIAEWVEDDYAEKAYDSAALSAQKNPPPHVTGVVGVPKVIRGGSWASPPSEVRASARGRQAPDTRSVFVGVRCVWIRPKP